jgi:uncharacterized protein (TIGR02246 family)
MRHVWKLAAVAALALITSPTSASAQGVDQNTRQQIERIVATYVENFNKQDAAGIASLYTKDGVLVTRSEKAVKVGPQEIEQSTQDLFKMGYNHDKAGLDQVSPVGTDAAISVGEYQFTGKGESAPTKIDGHWTAVYVREGGAWKIRLLTAFSNPPPAPPAK